MAATLALVPLPILAQMAAHGGSTVPSQLANVLSAEERGACLAAAALDTGSCAARLADALPEGERRGAAADCAVVAVQLFARLASERQQAVQASKEAAARNRQSLGEEQQVRVAAQRRGHRTSARRRPQPRHVQAQRGAQGGGRRARA